MIFWVIAGLICLAVCSAVLAPLWRGAESTQAGAADIAVYRDQLDAVARDLERGIVTEEEAARLRLEIERRLLEADRRATEASAGAPQGGAPARGRQSRGAALAAFALVLCSSFALYWGLGAPGYPDLPLKLRHAASEQARTERPGQAAAEAGMPPAPVPEGIDPEVLDLIAQLRQAVVENPENPRGLELLAQYEAQLGDFAASAAAQAQLVQLRGEDVSTVELAGLADLMVLAAGGYVSPEAEAVVNAILAKEPAHPTARYYIGLMNAQIGRHDLAFNIWARLLAESDPEAAWVPPIRGQIMEQAIRAGVDYELPPLGSAPGPSAADVEAAGEMSAGERMEMIEGMVSSLSERLADEGGPPADWARLIRSLAVLGRHDQARVVYEEALVVFEGDSAAGVMLLSAAQAARIAE
ncbi:c-type cytochrome biogenesis protein CcmI [Alphaproteobacteria bacterium KMM 3653]|uniref:C-type cytochrome biogenesis protein CcmI n=1 Tax=Harenicola maris TaxID=2841044 RepID=A0AAP2G3H1_9RHOB|nr:c-type cytochrome biogenesis protein CcmI [Harenicola maris]